ncbi:MAG: hypothetical protein IJ565_03655 [Bacilli bacterium]|nr:hypothetical protein [Bacilli bacterium]
MNNNNLGGNSTTGKNAYKELQDQAKAKASAVSSTKLGDAAGKALTASGHPIAGKVANMAGNALAQSNYNQNASDSENIEQNEANKQSGNNRGGLSSFASKAGTNLLKNGLGSSNVANKIETAEKAAKVIKFISKIPPVVWPILGYVAIGLIVLILIIASINAANVSLNDLIEGGEKTYNFLTLNGFSSNTEQIQKKIDQAANDCKNCLVKGNINNNPGLDKGILYATVNNQVIFGSDIFEADGEKSTDETPQDLQKDFGIDASSSHSFYTMKNEMLGSSSEAGTMIYSLMGEEISVSCEFVDSSERSSIKANNVVQLYKYAYNGLLAGADVSINSAKQIIITSGAGPFGMLSQIANVAKTIDNIASFGSQNSNYLSYKVELSKFIIDENVLNRILNDMSNLHTEIDGCESQPNRTEVRYNAQNQPYNVTLYPTAEYETTKINDYEMFFNYISKVYVPTVYNSVWKKYTDDEKKFIIKSTIYDIVNSRNDYYGIQGEDNYLIINYDFNGSMVAYVDTDEGGGGPAYVSDVPVGTKGTNWKQFGAAWSGVWLGSSSNSSIRKVGCYITSIAILMANSGTYITQDTFDPGVLAKVVKDNNGFTSGGSLAVPNGANPAWKSLAPNFIRVDAMSGDILKGKTKNQIATIVSERLNAGDYVVLHVKNGAHFVAVVGIENGRVVIADPGVSATPTYLDDDKLYPPGTIVGLRVFRDNG